MTEAETISSTARLFVEAARVVASVTARGRSLDEALHDRRFANDISGPALQAISFGVLRWQPRIEIWLAALLERPAALRQPEIRGLLSVGLYQLAFSAHPSHAIVHQAVEAARLLDQPRSASLVNAILRRFLRERAELEAAAISEPAARFAHPRWLIGKIRADWPQDWERILAANNEPPPMWLRVNRLRGTVPEYLALLAAKGIQAASCEWVPNAVLLATPMDVHELPGFEAGRVSVQDAGAQLAAELLDARAGMRVLDACAAPGGKSCHLLERTPGLAELVALDRSAARLKQVKQNLERLGLQAQTLVGDAAELQKRYDGSASFQRILLDAPCSAIGVIRRHPDIKALRRPADIAKLAREQARLLSGVWPLLQPGGRLLYASCSILRAEGADAVAAFLDEESTAVELPLERVLHGLGRRPDGGPGWQILPGEAAMDGFYYACLEKRH